MSGVESKAAIGRGMVTEDEFKVTCELHFDVTCIMLFELTRLRVRLSVSLAIVVLEDTVVYLIDSLTK